MSGIARQPNLNKVLRHRVQVTGGEFTVGFDGILIQAEGVLNAGETSYIELPHTFNLDPKGRGGSVVYVTYNPLLYSLGTLTGPSLLVDKEAKLGFRFESDVDIDFTELDYVVKLAVNDL